MAGRCGDSNTEDGGTWTCLQSEPLSPLGQAPIIPFVDNSRQPPDSCFCPVLLRLSPAPEICRNRSQIGSLLCFSSHSEEALKSFSDLRLLSPSPILFRQHWPSIPDTPLPLGGDVCPACTTWSSESRACGHFLCLCSDTPSG